MAGLGEALLYLGQAAPGIGKSFDEARRQKEQDEIERKKVAAALESLARENEAKAIANRMATSKEQKTIEAGNKFAEYSLVGKQLKQVSDIPVPEQGEKREGMGFVPDYGYTPRDADPFAKGNYAGPINPELQQRLGKLAKMSQLERANEMELPAAAAYDEGARSTLEQLNKENSAENQLAKLEADRAWKEAEAQRRRDFEEEQLRRRLNAKPNTTNPLKDEKLQAEIDLLNEKKDKAARLEKDAAEKQKIREDTATNELNSNISMVDSLLSGLEQGKIKTGIVSNQIAKRLSSSKEATEKAMFDQLVATLTFDKMKAIKATGGSGMGAMSDADMKLMERAATTLSYGGDPERNARALKLIKTTFENARKIADGGNSDGATKASSYLDEIRARRASKGGQ